MLRTKRLNALTVVVVLMTALFAGSVAAQLLLDDPLQGSTSGAQSGGSFVSGGWQVTGDYDCIFWHVTPISNGAAEFYCTGLHDSWPHKTELFHMYDWTVGNADYMYNGGYRDNPYKHFIRKSGADYKNNTMELLWQILPNYTEPDTAALTWSTGTNYCFRVEWYPEGGNSRFKVYRDGGLLYTEAIPGNWTPSGQSIRIAASNRHMGEDAEVGAKYSYVKVWNMSGAVPGAPSVSMPSNGETIKGPLSFIKWTGDNHDRYHVHVCSSDNPDASVVWDSGEVMSARDWAWTGALGNLGNYYIYIKLGSVNGWSDWSAAGRWFHTDSTYVGSNNIKVLGQSVCDANGPMLGLGFTYMTAMYQCKNNPSLFNSDLAFMSARGYKYARILSMVGWYNAWLGKEIAPVTFQAHDGYWVNAWPDYWQQFRNTIDTMFDTYGIRSEITIFADAQLIEGSGPRQAHLDNLLANLAGREHKVMHLEVANEYWQNGFPDPGGMEEVRAWGQYLTDRTSIPVALSAPCSPYDDSTSLLNMYTGSTADITTEHLSRTIGTQEGGWLPVRDAARLASFYPTLAPGSSNEPIGPGSSVAPEYDVTRLVSAAAFAYIAGLPLYVYHTDAGVFHVTNFQDKEGVSNYQYLDDILPPDISSWVYNDGLEGTAPFTVYCNGVPNQYWTSNFGATSACHRNIGGRKGIEFVCYPQGIKSGGCILEARQQLTFQIWDPLTGNLVMDTTTKETGQQINLSGSLGAYIIKGAYGPTLPPPPGGSKTLNSKGQTTITIDGNSSDWNLAEYTDLIRGGQGGDGDTALVGFDGGNLYYGAYSGVLPTDAADHTAKVYSRSDASYLYFLARCDDNDMRYNNPTSANWLNDCIEFYIDPSHDGGSTAIDNSTSDIQLDIDANNQKNVYMCTSGYTTQVLAGVTSAVVRNGSGWWLEARISKSVLDPDLPSFGNIFGLDFNFRDNDNNNDAGLTTLYTWNDSNYSGFPSKIPGNWGACYLDNYQTPYSGVIQIPGTIQAENYDNGGNSISYYDSSSGNSGGQLRSDDVDVEACSDTGGGYDVGYTTVGEWLEYTVNVAATGDYSIKTRVASAVGGGSFRILIDGSDVSGLRSFADTGGWQNWTTIIAPARYLTAGQHILRFVFEGGGLNLNYIDIATNGADAVSIDLGNPDSEDGMNHISNGDGHTEPWTVAGHNARANVAADDNYMYFNVTEAYCYQGSKPDLYITYDYYDTGTGAMALHYDSITNIWATQAGPTLTNSLTWKTYTFHVTDAYFGNRQNYGADFRIAGPGGGAEFEIDTVCVYEVACAPPTAPASASANPATICSGASSTLTATGGSGENCRWYTGSCGGTLVGTGTSINVSPTSTTTYYVRWETATCGNSTCATTSVTVNPLPVAPTSASASPTTICSGASSTLTATGGSGTTLRWMTGSCGGTSVGTGNNLVVSPTSTTTYYVRWENSCGNSTCQTTTVTVNPLPVAPTSASASPTTICSGASSTLTATGGSGTTLRWMTGSCGGTSVGTGNNLVVSPTSTTTYYVRWENSCGNSSCQTTTVTVNPLPTAPTSASASPTTICSGASSTLTATGGSGTTLRWMTGSCGGTSVGTGNNLVVSPTSTTTYYVRWENSCGNSTCQTTTVTVNPLPVAPTSASASPTTICSGASSTLTATGGSGTTLRWMTGSCGGTSVGTGNNLVVSPASTTTYYVRWENSCGNSTCQTTTVTVNPLPVAPTSASANPSSIPSGSSSTLTATGGSGTTLRWMTGSCGGTSVGTGNNLVVSPTSTTTYYVRWENSCGNSTCQTTTVTVTSDTTPPTFGGSISPSITNSLTPTITVTAQDTGTGLNVGSSEFAYSVDGGTSFCTYVGRYTLHSVGTGGGGGNQYWYPDFYHPTSYTIASGDHLQYDIYLNNTNGTGAVDLEGSFGNLRDSGILDQNGLSGHANTNLYSYAYHQWYHRDFNLSSGAGYTITAYEMAHETDNGVSDFLVRNVIITNNGLVKDKAADADAWVSVSDTIGPGITGYSSTTGPEMLTSDPASPASCTGSNGTTAQQTVSALFSNRLMPLVAGNTNRVKYHIRDMNGNMALSSTFTLTVDQTAPTCTIGTPNPTTVSPGQSFTYPVTYADNVGIGSVNLTTAKCHVQTVTGTASATISSVSNGTTTTPTVNLTNATGSGTLRIYIDAAAATDTAGNTDAGATAGTVVTVSGTVTLNNSTFNSNADGWTLTVWRAATQYGYGTFAWGSAYGRTGGGIRNTGTGSSDNTDRCTREGGEAQKTISTVGYSNIKVYYDLDVNTLGNNNTGAGVGGCAVDHNLIDEQITVFYSTNGGGSWTEAEYLLRATLLGSYASWGTRMIDLTGVPAVNNNANFRLRFRWQCNSGADQQNLDNIVVTSN